MPDSLAKVKYIFSPASTTVAAVLFVLRLPVLPLFPSVLPTLARIIICISYVLLHDKLAPKEWFKTTYICYLTISVGQESRQGLAGCL